GLAFQIVDDLFDYLSEPEVTGKPVATDLAEGKVTLPLIAALRMAEGRERRALLKLAGRRRWTTSQWAELRACIERAGGFGYARARRGVGLLPDLLGFERGAGQGDRRSGGGGGEGRRRRAVARRGTRGTALGAARLHRSRGARVPREDARVLHAGPAVGRRED